MISQIYGHVSGISIFMITTSNAWAGYVVTGNDVRDVKGAWKVLYVDCSGSVTTSASLLEKGHFRYQWVQSALFHKRRNPLVQSRN